MGRYLKPYDKDYMRVAMMKQEETFQHQVHELHRLYGVQKVLMDDMKSSDITRPRKSSNAQTNLEIRNEDDKIYEESGLELTLATGSESRRKSESFSSTDRSGTKCGAFRVVPDVNSGDHRKDRERVFHCLSLDMT